MRVLLPKRRGRIASFAPGPLVAFVVACVRIVAAFVAVIFGVAMRVAIVS